MARGVLARLGVTRTGLWRIGTEDPSTWSTLDARSEAETLRALARIEAPAEPHVRGHGELIVRTSVAVEGSRHVALDAEGLIERADLTTLPSPPRFERMGATESRQIVLTFDDGPDPEWTPRILEVLAAAHAPATFFAVGAAAAAHPDLVRRLVREGHTVASHTYDHPHMDALDARAARRELDRTARVLEALTGHEIRLYRAPYTALFDLTDPRELAAHSSAFDAGYLYVAASIDPHDWETRTAAQIADAIVRGAEEGGHVVVLHDGGGDRSRTVRGLALALPVLRERGYEVVSLETYAGLPRGALTPPLPPAAPSPRFRDWRHGSCAGLGDFDALGALRDLHGLGCSACPGPRGAGAARPLAPCRGTPRERPERQQPSTFGHCDRACLQRVTRDRAERPLAPGGPVP